MNDPCFTTNNEELLLGRLAATRDAADMADTSSLQQQEDDDGDSLVSSSSSLSSWLLTCPLSLERMQDPVVVFPSGHSYDRQSICESLLHFPNLDPKSGVYYREPLRYATNYALRNLLQQDCPEYRVVPYNDAYFAKAYQQAWREKITDKQTTTRHDDDDNQHHHDPYDRRRRQVPPPIHNTAVALFSSRLRQAAMVILVVTVISWGVWHKAAKERRRQQQHARACAQLRTWSPASAWYVC